MSDLLTGLRHECYRASASYHDNLGNCLSRLFEEDGTGAKAWLTRSRQSADEYDIALSRLLSHLHGLPDCEPRRAEVSRTRRLLELLNQETLLMARWLAILSLRKTHQHLRRRDGS